MNKINELPLVSIVAVCHKHEAYVIETLESIRNQTYKNIELIIINNLNDSCKQIIEDWIKTNSIECKFIQNEQPQSVPKNFNLGLSFIHGKYFQGLACDDVLMNNKIEKQVELFENLSCEYACVYGDMNTIDEKGKLLDNLSVLEKRVKKSGRPKFPEGRLVQELSILSAVPAPSVLLKTDIIRELGNYDENYLFEDWPMWVKLSRKGYKFAAVNSIVVNYRILPNSMDRSADLNYTASIISIYTKNADFFDVKNQNVRNAWHKRILTQKQYSYWASLYSYFTFVRYTRDFSLKKFIRQIKPFNVRRFFS